MNPSELIDKQIADLADWRGQMLAKLRKVIHDADSEIIEKWKWMGSPCWSHDGLICVANAHKDKVKVTFSQGASLPDPDKLFNACLEENRWRAIDLYEGDRVNERALKNICAAVAHNRAGRKRKTPADARGIRPKVHKIRNRLLAISSVTMFMVRYMRGGHCGGLPTISLEARHEGFSVLSNRSCSSAAFCCRTYTGFSPIRPHMGS